MLPIGETRRLRLLELVKKYGSVAALNEALGRTRTDATLSQIINKSPDSKTKKPKSMGSTLARRIERDLKLPDGLMDSDPNRAASAPPPKGAVFKEPTPDEWELLKHWRDLLGKDKRAKLAEIAALAEERRAEKEELFENAGVTAIMEKAAHASRKRTANASVEPGAAKLKQRSLLGDEN